MITTWLISGDIHGNLERFIGLNVPKPETAIILLGDCGFNYYGIHTGSKKVYPDKRDIKLKEDTQNLGYRFYCLRGNHEFRPELLPDIVLEYDEDVQGEVYYEPRYSNIRYFKNWGIYQIGEWKTAVIAGAYSVDKFYRIGRRYQWFDDEQLSDSEQLECWRDLADQNVDLVLTHTCPYSWMPTDLFLPSIDQSTVDNKTEVFLEQLREVFDYNIWLFGHFHDDRYVRPGVEMLYEDIRDLDQLMKDWYSSSWTIPNGKRIDPNFFK